MPLNVTVAISILIDHHEEQSANLWQHIAMQLSFGCCKANLCDNFEADHRSRKGIFHGLLEDFFLLKASLILQPMGTYSCQAVPRNIR